ncbi:MAG: ferritin-like domain-containing protein [Candidatus Sericytochromatia bacterium]
MYPDSVSAAEKSLIRLLQLAHAGERAAALAYQGHAASWWARRERATLAQIEAEEWQHRSAVAEMLRQLNAAPDPKQENIMWGVGSLIGLLCHLGGWLIPMYGAGKLESGNIWEYEYAARLAQCARHPEMIDALLEMAEVEWEHEAYFRSAVKSHKLGKVLPLWKIPAAKAQIRTDFAAFIREPGALSPEAARENHPKVPKETTHA